MKNKTLLFVLCLLFGSAGLNAQTKVHVETPGAKCKLAMISDEEAGQGQYGWWSIWSQLSQEGGAPSSPFTFEVSPGTYTLIVYWEDNNDQSDGIVLEKIQVHPALVSMDYEFHAADFTEWNCLSCPWLCVFNGKDYVKHSEVLKDVTGYENRTTTSTELDAAAVIDGVLKFRIKEEKDEISHLDRIVLKAGDKELAVTAASESDLEKLAEIDDNFVMLKKGEQIDLEVKLPADWTAETPLHLEVSGFYHPEAEFISEITRKLLNRGE